MNAHARQIRRQVVSAVIHRARQPHDYMTTEEFRDRIRQLCGIGPEQRKKTNPALVRTPEDRGYYPPTKTKGTKVNAEIEGLLTDLDNSCISAAAAVADHIRTVAENGPEYATPDALRTEAEELEGWAKYLRERITVNGIDGSGRGVPA